MSTTAPPAASPPDVLPRRGLSVRGHLAIFTAVLVAPVILFVGFLLWKLAANEQARLEREARETAQAVAVAVDRDVTGLLASLDVLSISPSLQAEDLEAFHRQASELARRQDIVPVLIALPSRQQLVNAQIPWGTELPVANLPASPEDLATEAPFVTNLFTSQASGAPSFAVARALVRNGRPAYVLALQLSPDRLRRILVEARLPERYTASIIDRSGIILARNTRHEEFVGKPATRDLQEATAGQSGTWLGTTLEGVDIFGAYHRSALTGYRAALGIRESDLNEPLRRSVSLFAALGIVIAVLSTALGLVFGQRITVPIQALAKQAVRLGRGEPVREFTTGLREADEVGRELAQAAEARRSREEELHEATEEVQRFAYIVSHDLRSPLVNIMGFTTELEAVREHVFKRLDALRAGDQAERNEDRRLAEDFDEAIAFIKASINKMDRLIAAILRLSREGRREFKPERIDMEALVDGIRASVAHQAGEAGAMILRGRLPAITSDRLALEQIFSNLIDNAVKYLRKGVPGRVEISGRETASGLAYEVRDNGRGIDPRDRDRVFELFRRSGTQDRPGEGIGLAHVRALVRRLGGSITLTSTQGEGSVFEVRLPRRWLGQVAAREAT